MQDKLLTTITGTQFRPQSARDRLNDLQLKEPLFLERDAANPYDSNAIKVLSLREGDNRDEPFFVGFIPKADNWEVAAWLDAGGLYEARVAQIMGYDKRGNAQVSIAVEPIASKAGLGDEATETGNSTAEDEDGIEDAEGDDDDSGDDE